MWTRRVGTRLWAGTPESQAAPVDVLDDGFDAAGFDAAGFEGVDATLDDAPVRESVR